MSFTLQPLTVYLKTPQGRAEVAARALGLSVLQRRLLILSDGVLTAGKLQTMLGSPIEDNLQHLLSLGLLQPKGAAPNPLAPAPAKSAPVKAVPLAVAPETVATATRTVQHTAASLAAAPVLTQVVPKLVPTQIPVAPAQLAASLPDNDEALEDDLNSDFSEELGIDSVSHFERDSSLLLQTPASAYSDPSSTLQRAMTSRGISLGRAYLINLSSRMLDARDIRLVRSIAQIKTEGDLYHQFELLIDTISSRLGSAAINEILEQFDEQINQG